MIDASQFKTTNAIEDFSLRAANERTFYVADQIMTPAYVTRAQYKRYQYDFSNYRLLNTKSDSKAIAGKSDYGVFTLPGQASLYKWSADIDPQDIRDADNAVSDMEQDSALTCLDALLINKEQLTLNKITTAANFPTALKVTLAAGSRWSDVGGDPVGDVKNGRIAIKTICGKTPNAMVIGWQALEALKVSEALKDRIKWTNGTTITEDMIKNLLGLDELIISKAQYNANNEGAAAQTLSDIIGNFAVLFVKDPNQQRRTVCFGRTYYVTGGGSASAPGGFYTYKYMDNTRGGPTGRVETLEMGMEYDIDFATVDTQASAKAGAGYLITTPI